MEVSTSSSSSKDGVSKRSTGETTESVWRTIDLDAVPIQKLTLGLFQTTGLT